MTHTLFNKADARAIVERIEKIGSASSRQWGKMDAGEMLAHCVVSLQTAMGENRIPPLFFVARWIGALTKAGVLSDKPFGKNSPTDRSYRLKGPFDIQEQKSRLIAAIRKFSDAGPKGATTHPHPFFGTFTQEQWGVFAWKHLDHHLRQFGV